MKRVASLYAVALFGVVAVAAISTALERPSRISVVVDLPSDVRPLDIPPLPDMPEAGEERSGGETTVRDTGVHAFGRGPMNMTDFSRTWTDFREGRRVFERNWYAMERGRLLLGPSYNAGSCSHCHKSDGRGRPPLSADEQPELMVMRLSIPHGAGALPEPAYGEQLSYYAVKDGVPEGTFRIDYEELEGSFADGSRYSLRMPAYEFRDLGYGAMASDVQTSPRVPPATFGLGLLEAVPERAILALADPDDRNGDGISGRPNYVPDARTGTEVLGRFGWKANQPTLEQQILKAFIADIGITSRMYPDDGTSIHRGNKTLNVLPELSDSAFNTLHFYIRMLAVPERRHWNDPNVLRGKGLFRALGCTGCHTSLLVTGTMEGYPELSNQTIRPYTDMLLHDMGEALADNRPDGRANGREWRTPPLWGIGLVKVVNSHTFFLHDGRARTIEEAILWHGGEATEAQARYRRLSKQDRGALLAFLESL